MGGGGYVGELETFSESRYYTKMRHTWYGSLEIFGAEEDGNHCCGRETLKRAFQIKVMNMMVIVVVAVMMTKTIVANNNMRHRLNTKYLVVEKKNVHVMSGHDIDIQKTSCRPSWTSRSPPSLALPSSWSMTHDPEYQTTVIDKGHIAAMSYLQSEAYQAHRHFSKKLESGIS